MIQFKPATQEDAQTIARLHTESWQQAYRNMLSEDYLNHRLAADHLASWTQKLASVDPHQLTIAAWDDGALAGFVRVDGTVQSEHGVYLENLHVDKRLRGQGLGKALFSQAAQWVAQWAPKTPLYLEVLKHNHAAIAFYRSLGGIEAAQSIWNAPDGQAIEEFVYQWPHPEDFGQ